MNKATSLIIGVVFALIILVGGYFVLIAPVAKTNNIPVRIGVLIPLTGDASSYGISVKRGIELAKKEYKAGNMELLYIDTKCESDLAVNAAEKLIHEERVHAIIGELCSGATSAVTPIANSNKVVLISPASTAPKLSLAGEYFFRTVPSDSAQGKFGASLVIDEGYKTLAILYSSEDYGIGFKEVLEKEFRRLQGTVVAAESIERTSTDLSSQLTNIKESGAEAIYIISNSPDSIIAALNQISDMNINASLFGSEALKSQDIIDKTGDASAGLIITSVSNGTKEFLRLHKEEYNEEPGPFAAQGFDAFHTLQFVFNELGATEREDVKKLLSEIIFSGMSGPIKFDSNGDIKGKYDVYIVSNGKFVPKKVF